MNTLLLVVPLSALFVLALWRRFGRAWLKRAVLCFYVDGQLSRHGVLRRWLSSLLFRAVFGRRGGSVSAR